MGTTLVLAAGYGYKFSQEDIEHILGKLPEEEWRDNYESLEEYLESEFWTEILSDYFADLNLKHFGFGYSYYYDYLDDDSIEFYIYRRSATAQKYSAGYVALPPHGKVYLNTDEQLEFFALETIIGHEFHLEPFAAVSIG